MPITKAKKARNFKNLLEMLEVSGTSVLADGLRLAYGRDVKQLIVLEDGYGGGYSLQGFRKLKDAQLTFRALYERADLDSDYWSITLIDLETGQIIGSRKGMQAGMTFRNEVNFEDVRRYRPDLESQLAIWAWDTESLEAGLPGSVRAG